MTTDQKLDELTQKVDELRIWVVHLMKAALLIKGATDLYCNQDDDMERMLAVIRQNGLDLDLSERCLLRRLEEAKD